MNGEVIAIAHKHLSAVEPSLGPAFVRFLVAALIAVPAAVHATPTGTLALSATQDGAALTTEVQGGAVSGSIIINAQYSLTNQGSASAHLEIDLCSPVVYVQQVSSGSFQLLPASTCLDGNGNASAQRVSSQTINGTSDSQGITGIFSVNPFLVDTIILDGTVWTVPARLILDTSPPQVLATTSLVLTIRVHPAPYLQKDLLSVTLARNPANTEDGYNVTWLLAPGNVGFAGVFLQGTSSVVDPVPAGAIYVAGARSGGDPTFPGLPAFNAAHLNTNFTLTPVNTADPASVRSVTMTVDNLVSNGNNQAANGANALLTYWYPKATTTAVNTANATFSNGQTGTATARAFLGEGAGFLAKYHLCPTPQNPYDSLGYQSATAHLPNFGDNIYCAWGPNTPLRYQVQMSAQISEFNSDKAPMHDPVLIDVLPPEVTLVEFTGLFENAGQDNVTAAWTLSYASAPGCDQNTLSWTSLTIPAAASTLANVRCLKAERRGLINATQAFYAVKLSDGERASLEATPGGLQFVENKAFLSGGFSSVNYTDGNSIELDLKSTFWNSRTPGMYLDNGGVNQVNQDAFLYGAVPFRSDGAVNNFLGFQDLTFAQTLPLEVDLRGPPTIGGNTGLPQMVDDNGAAAQLNCTWSAQNRTTNPVTPASYRCTIPGHVPSFRPGMNPFDVCSAPDYCTQALYTVPFPWNIMGFTLPIRIASGTQGEQVHLTAGIWANPGNIASNLPTPPGSSESNPVTTTASLTIGGTSQLAVQSSAQGLSVAVGQNAKFFVDYSNTGSVSTTNTYVYDFFGIDPTTNQSLANAYPALNCSTQRGTLVSVAQTSGVPATTLEYTTTNPPTIATATWSAVAPANLALVTGVRFKLNSAFSATAGVYGPNDAAGRELITLSAPNDPGKRLCNMGAIVASGFTPAGALSASATLTIISHCSDPTGCDPTADPGPSQNISANADSCGVAYSLDATRSTKATIFKWFENGVQIATGVSPSVTFSAGVHVITLVASTVDGITASANVTITVTDVTDPVLSCPASVDPVVDESCGISVNVAATAHDNCAGDLPVTCDTSGLQSGATSILCSATDAAGNTGHCTVAINPVANQDTGLTFGAINPFHPAPDGNACNDNLATVEFTWKNGCAGEGTPSFSGSYHDASGDHAVDVFQWYNYNRSGSTYTGTFAVALQNGISVFDSLTITGQAGALTASSTLPLKSETCACTQVLYGPSRNEFGTVMFEDLWPGNGDLDFNDNTVAYNYEFLMDDAAANVVKMQITYNVLSLGASIHNGLFLHLPMLPGAASSIERYQGTWDPNSFNYVQSGGPVTIQSKAGETDLVIPIVDDARSLFPGVGGFINTDPALPSHYGNEVALVITFAQPIPIGQLDTGLVPYDLFMAQTNDYGHQVHLSQYPGTPLANPALFQTKDDNTGAVAHYVNKQGLPFALNIPYYTNWAQERVSIDKVFPDITGFASSGGATNQDWFATNVNYVLAYTQGANSTNPPNAIPFLPDLDGGNACGSHGED